MRSSGCGFLKEQVCHLRLETTGMGHREKAKRQGRVERRRKGVDGEQVKEDGRALILKGQREESEFFLMMKHKTQMMTRESKKMPVGSLQLITADSLCLDPSPW